MIHKPAAAFLSLLISASAWAQQPVVAADGQGINPLGRPTFITKAQLEASSQQFSPGAPTSTPPAAAGASLPQAPAIAPEVAMADRNAKSIPLPPLGAAKKTTDQKPATASAKSASASLKAPAEAPRPQLVFDGRPENTPIPELQWGQETINRQEALWGKREQEYAKRYAELLGSAQMEQERR